ncbi:MAG: LCP family protein [Lachnospiraceae bacterium]|nr:LCP family protein [Lachnospiraceae bacterium]
MSEQQTKKKSTKKNKQRNKIILIVVELIVLAVLAVALYGISKLEKIERPDDFVKEDVEVNEDIQSETIEVMDNFRTIAVFGLDNRSNGKLTSGNSDVIIVVSIDNDTKEVKMCSIYRDTYLDIGGGKFRKANSAFSAGGPQGAISMLNKNLDLNITDYVTVDFNAVVECIDLLGGIEMTITDEEAHFMIGYMEEINKLTGHSSKVPEAGGTYVLDGVQATAYARIRYTAGDDYKRTERQRDVIMAMAKKAQKSDLGTINKVIDAMFDDISTSFSNADLIALAAQVFEYEITGSVGFPFLKNTITLGSKGSVVAPCTLETNVIELHKFLYNNEEYVPSSTVKANSMKIESDTGYGSNDGF